MTDMWAFGCILLEVARTGNYRTFGSDYHATIYDPQRHFVALQDHEFGLLRSEQVAIINEAALGCLALDPTKRPTAHDLLAHLSSFNWDN
jgi:serine/threonine protein kinase